MNQTALMQDRPGPSWWNDHHTRSWERARLAVPHGASERALRYGYGASSYYSDHLEWNRALEAKLRALGKNVTLTVHPGTGHAFMGPHNALGTLDEALAAQIWPEVFSFLRRELA